jgi:hypothetical protein
MATSSKRFYKIIFLLLALFVVARFTQAPDFSASMLGVGFILLPWLCFTIAVYVAIMVRTSLKKQKIIEAKLDLLVERSNHPISSLASIDHLSRH